MNSDLRLKCVPPCDPERLREREANIKRDEPTLKKKQIKRKLRPMATRILILLVLLLCSPIKASDTNWHGGGNVFVSTNVVYTTNTIVTYQTNFVTVESTNIIVLTNSVTVLQTNAVSMTNSTIVFQTNLTLITVNSTNFYNVTNAVTTLSTNTTLLTNAVTVYSTNTVNMTNSFTVTNSISDPNLAKWALYPTNAFQISSANLSQWSLQPTSGFDPINVWKNSTNAGNIFWLPPNLFSGTITNWSGKTNRVYVSTGVVTNKTIP